MRNKLIVAFIAATVVPLAATLWITTSLLDRSLAQSTTHQLDELSKSLEQTAREFYQLARQDLKKDADSGNVRPLQHELRDQAQWPQGVEEFWNSGESERFILSGADGNHLEYLRRRADGVSVYSRELGNVRMQQLTEQYRRARAVVAEGQAKDLRRGLTITLIVLVLTIWIVAFVLLVYLAHRISELQENRDRLIYLTQISSWQTLARKMAHELKNSLTPIRLTVEEISARSHVDQEFMKRAVQIVVDEIETLETRVRAFSEFSSEPPAQPSAVDINGMVEERLALLRPAHTSLKYSARLSEHRPQVFADADQVKGILTNLLENAADALGTSGEILSITSVLDGKVFIEIHDSGPGLTEDSARTLFEPTITFKKHGMGLGLSIARKSALLNGGDIMLVTSELGGAAFRVILPKA
jgi:two-component system, NtrC family, nitrogen regulation sensor histidine kinase NtrY